MLPFYAYLMVITTIGIFAALRASKGKPILYGALSFILSDSILAINEFMVLVPASDYLSYDYLLPGLTPHSLWIPEKGLTVSCLPYSMQAANPLH